MSFFLILLFSNFSVEGLWQEVFCSIHLLSFGASSYSPVIKTSGLCHVVFTSLIVLQSPQINAF